MLLVTPWAEVITFISEYLFLREPTVSRIDDIIKIAALYIKTTIKNSKKIKRIRDYILTHPTFVGL